jgi:hypothetical protein
MSLNHHAGEKLGDLGDDYVVVPPHKWADTPMWHKAASAAAAAFVKAGAMAPVRFDADAVLVQEYHAIDTLVFVFARHIAGQEYFHPVTIEFPPEAAAHLRLIGRWPKPAKH